MENNNLKLEGNVKNLDSGKVVKLNVPPLIKDEDINSLFMGLIKLIKRNAACEYERKYKALINALRKEINLLKLENKLLKDEQSQ